MAPASTANSASQVPVAASGTVYVGTPASVTAPTDSDSALDVDLIQMGFVSDEGLTIRDSKNVEEIRAWQSPYPIKRVVTERMFEISFALEQWNWLTIPYAFGGGTLTEPTAGEYKFVPPAGDAAVDERCMVVQWAIAGFDYRLWIPAGMVSETVEITLVRNENAMFPITFAANFNGTDPIYTLFTDDPAFEVA